MKEIKIVVVGDGAVGKTSLLLAHAKMDLDDTYTPTIMDTYSSRVKVKKDEYEVFYYDTAGQEDYDRLRPLAYPNADVFIVCFSTVNYDSFFNVEAMWIPEIRYYMPHAPFVIVGTQIDRRQEPEGRGRINRRTGYVNSHVASEHAKRLKAVDYIECSAITRENVDLVFEKAIMAAVQKSTRSPCCRIL